MNSLAMSNLNKYAICRPGAPFLKRFRRTRQWLLEAGLMSLWTDDVMNNRRMQLRQKQLSNKESNEVPTIVSDKVTDVHLVIRKTWIF